MSVGSHRLHGMMSNLNKGAGNVPHRSKCSVAITSRVVTILYLTDSVGSLGRELSGVVVKCACKGISRRGPMATNSLRTRNTVATLLGSTLGPGLMRALRRIPTVMRNKPFTGVTRKYGSMATAGVTVGLTSCTVARTNFNTSLNTRGFLSVGYHVTNLGPDTIMVMTAMHTLGCGNNITGTSLGGRGLRTLRGNVPGLLGRISGVGGMCGLPYIITVGTFPASAGTRLSFMRTGYGRLNIGITLSRM